MKKALVIGAGLGGLSTALRLTSQGYEVEIVEKFDRPGGRLNQIKQDGFTFDMGPSFFSMSYEFEELFKSCNFKNPLQFNQLDPLYSVFFADKEEPFLIFKNREKLINEFNAIEPDFDIKLKRYLKQASEIFHDTEDIVIRQNFTSLADYLFQLTKVPLKHAPKMFRSLWSELDKHFESHEVKVIFSLVAFFLGATPFNTPAVYSLLNYTELEHDGYWNVKGGMYQITEKIVEELKRRNVKMHFNTEIKAVNPNGVGVKSFVDQNGKEWNGDVYVVNADAAAFRGKILNSKKYTEKKLDKMEWTLAPFTIYLGVEGKIDKLHHHNYFLGNNFKEYASKIFTQSVNPEKPYYYVNVSSRSNPDCAPEGCENLFILCPVPDLRFKADWSDRDQLANAIIQDLSERTGTDISKKVITKKIMDPVDWRNSFNLYKGSGLGLAHGMNQIGGFRPKNKDEQYNNLYYVGASTVPGTGLPIVVISSRLVTERIIHEH